MSKSHTEIFETIMKELEIQKIELIETLKNNKQLGRKYVANYIFNENDLLDKALEEHAISIDDFEFVDEVRDFQNIDMLDYITCCEALNSHL